jgi:sulfur carrier protein
MQIVINGSTETLPAPALTIAELLQHSGVESPDMVSVQLNGEFIDRQDYGSKSVTDGDEVDFLYFMGGGRA